MARRFRYDPASDQVVEVKTRSADMGFGAVVSDAIGFPIQALADREADRKANGFSGIEFKPDPQVPEFCQVHGASRKELLKYAKHLGYQDQGKTGYLSLSEDDFARARELAGRRFDEKEQGFSG